MRSNTIYIITNFNKKTASANSDSRRKDLLRRIKSRQKCLLKKHACLHH